MLTFRNADLNDLDELSLINTPTTSEQKENWKKLQQRRIQESANGQYEFIVAVLNDEIIGHVIVDYSEQDPHMQALLVKDDLRNNGYGSMIIEEVEKRIKDGGARKIKISVNPDNNPNALRLYKRLGYKETEGEKYLEYIDPIDGAEDWVIDLEKKL